MRSPHGASTIAVPLDSGGIVLKQEHSTTVEPLVPTAERKVRHALTWSALRNGGRQKEFSMTANMIVRHLATHGAVTVRGVLALRNLRAAIISVAEMSNLTITFDPSSDAALVDYLGVAAVDASKAALKGALLGLLLGALLGRPMLGMATGAGIGATAGGGAGLLRVRKGWRIVAKRARDGVPYAHVVAEA
jgi:hypothetical protein